MGNRERGGRAAHLRGALITAPLPLRPPAAHLRRCRLRPDPELRAGRRGAPEPNSRRGRVGQCPTQHESGIPQSKSMLCPKPGESGSLPPPLIESGTPPPAQISARFPTRRVWVIASSQPRSALPALLFPTTHHSPQSWAIAPTLSVAFPRSMTHQMVGWVRTPYCGSLPRATQASMVSAPHPTHPGYSFLRS